MIKFVKYCRNPKTNIKFIKSFSRVFTIQKNYGILSKYQILQKKEKEE